MLRIFLTYSFKPFLFKSNFNNSLDFKSIEDLGLYVHIPFCKSLCGFCPYCKEIYDKEKAALYKKALIKEIDLLKNYEFEVIDVDLIFAIPGQTINILTNDINTAFDAIVKINVIHALGKK